MAHTASFSGKDKNIRILDNHEIFHLSLNNKDLLQTLCEKFPGKFEELVKDDHAFTKNHIQPRLKNEISQMDSYKIILDHTRASLVAIIKNLAYLQDLSDPQDIGSFAELSLSPYRRNNYLFHFSAFENINKDKYFASVRHKYPGFGVLARDAFNIIDVAKKSVRPIPVEFAKGTYLTHIADESIKKKGNHIIVRCSLTDDLISYISEFDSRHDALESRTIYGPHYYANCEIDTETGTMQKCG